MSGEAQSGPEWDSRAQTHHATSCWAMACFVRSVLRAQQHREPGFPGSGNPSSSFTGASWLESQHCDINRPCWDARHELCLCRASLAPHGRNSLDITMSFPYFTPNGTVFALCSVFLPHRRLLLSNKLAQHDELDGEHVTVIYCRFISWVVLQAMPSGSVQSVAAVLIEGLKHKLLVYLLKKKQLERMQGNSEALKQFHYVFENYVNLLIWKVCLLCSERICCMAYVP